MAEYGAAGLGLHQCFKAAVLEQNVPGDGGQAAVGGDYVTDGVILSVQQLVDPIAVRAVAVEQRPPFFM